MKILALCRFTPRGCTFRRERHLLYEMSEHEKACPHRTIHCMAKHRGACHWEGSILEFTEHVRRHNCVHMMRSNPGHLGPFASFVSDFGLPGSTVLNKRTTSHWKPVLFVGTEFTAFLTYLTIRRSASGLWTLVLRSFSPKVMRDRIRVQLWVHGGNSMHKYSYRGGVVPHTMPNVEIMDARKLLILSDEQVRFLRDSDGILFHYNVSIDILPTPARPLRLRDANEQRNANGQQAANGHQPVDIAIDH